MKFAILGGTHGNEPVGVHVINHLKNCRQSSFLHSYETFHANPLAYQKKVRYVDSDLNRAFGKDLPIDGNEKNVALNLKEKIIGKFDFLIDLHTTTSNMGLTIILTHLDPNSLSAACFLKKKFPELKIIISMRAGRECPYTTQMSPSALTVEVGPVANNVVKAELVLKTIAMVQSLLSYSFTDNHLQFKTECFQTKGVIYYPTLHDPMSPPWMIHPEVDGSDFLELKNGAPLFINSRGETLPHTGEALFPLFINEAAYQESQIAMEYSYQLINCALMDFSAH